MFRIAGFRCIRPFGLRGKERPIHAPVSPAPSKIPYGGFSPVRHQTSIRVPPSSAPTQTYRHVPSSSCVHPLFLSGYLDLRPIRTRRTPTQNHSSSGPWLRSRFYCPAASTLTMATSETLALRHGLWIRPQRYSSARGSPIYSACPLACAAFHIPAVPTISSDCSSIAGAVFIQCGEIQQPLLPGQSGPA